MSEEKVTSIEAAAVLAIFANERYQISKGVPGEGGSWFESIEAVRHVLRNSEEIKSALDGGGKGAEAPKSLLDRWHDAEMAWLKCEGERAALEQKLSTATKRAEEVTMSLDLARQELDAAESRILELETEIKTRREIGSTMFECQQLRAKMDAARRALE
jgi:chromosome segregation ATPase